MKILELDMYQAAAVAAVMLVIGQKLVDRIDVLRRYCIPAPVVGGFIFAIVHTVLRGFGVVEFNMDPTLQNVFMTAFFCSVGFTAAFSMLKKGGINVLKFLALSVSVVVVQNAAGALLARLFGLDARLGLAMGSIPLVGGHGTAGSFGPFLEEMGVANATTVGIAAATYGLVAGCLIGGPIAASKIRRYHLKSEGFSSPENAATSVEVERDTDTSAIDEHQMLTAAVYIVIAVGIGTVVTALLKQIVTLPGYIGAMLVGAVIRNFNDAGKRHTPMNEISTLGNVCLSLFLGLAMISLKLWQLVDLALPMIVILLLQTVVIFLFASYLVFPVMGKTYDAATMASGFCGFGMGATPNAMANMSAVTKEHGPAELAFLVVPLVGSLFIDFFNGTIITIFANFLS